MLAGSICSIWAKRENSNVALWEVTEVILFGNISLYFSNHCSKNLVCRESFSNRIFHTDPILPAVKVAGCNSVWHFTQFKEGLRSFQLKVCHFQTWLSQSIIGFLMRWCPLFLTNISDYFRPNNAFGFVAKNPVISSVTT